MDGHRPDCRRRAAVPRGRQWVKPKGEPADGTDGELIADEILATQRDAAEATARRALALVQDNEYDQVREVYGGRQQELRRLLIRIGRDDRLSAEDKARLRRAIDVELESIEGLIAASPD